MPGDIFTENKNITLSPVKCKTWDVLQERVLVGTVNSLKTVDCGTVETGGKCQIKTQVELLVPVDHKGWDGRNRAK